MANDADRKQFKDTAMHASVFGDLLPDPVPKQMTSDTNLAGDERRATLGQSQIIYINNEELPR